MTAANIDLLEVALHVVAVVALCFAWFGYRAEREVLAIEAARRKSAERACTTRQAGAGGRRGS